VIGVLSPFTGPLSPIVWSAVPPPRPPPTVKLERSSLGLGWSGEGAHRWILDVIA